MTTYTLTLTDEKGYVLGEKLIKYSDISGKTIEDDKDAALIIVEFADKRKGRYRLDATLDEAEELGKKGRREKGGEG